MGDGLVAQLVRASLLHSGGRRFESCPVHHDESLLMRSDFLYVFLTSSSYNESTGDDRLRRARLVPDGKPRGTELVKSVHNLSANRTQYAAMPLAA